MDTTVQTINISTFRYVPELIAWAIGVILAVIMVRRGGLKAEKLLLAGCSLMFAADIISLLLGCMVPRLHEQGISAQQFGLIMSISGIPSLAGLVCLVWAFLAKFRKRRQAPA
jgi:hypothetical protein